MVGVALMLSLHSAAFYIIVFLFFIHLPPQLPGPQLVLGLFHFATGAVPTFCPFGIHTFRVDHIQQLCDLLQWFPAISPLAPLG